MGIYHTQRFGDTDIFPVPFEYEAIKHSWSGLKNELSQIDIETYEGRPFRRMLVPKPQGGFRVAIQLDPVDTLLYTALIYEAANLIEAQRIPKERKIACSYRVEIDSNGQLFSQYNGWEDFNSKSKELSDSGIYKYVVNADIADFYNQISHHRARNALELSGISSKRAKNFENFLMNLTRGQSRGVPVGPSASILLAEACLNDVDSFLLRKGYAHSRYVDDFRIFCINRIEAYKVLHDISEYLYTSHRLALQSSKTNIQDITQFIEKELIDPEKIEEQNKAHKINELVQKCSEHPNYPGLENVLYQQKSELDLNEIVRENLIELFNNCLEQNPLHLGTARYLLRRAKSLRTNVLHQSVLNNLDKLAPVMRDAMMYIIGTTSTKKNHSVGNALIEFYKTAELAFLPFVNLWISYVLTEKFTPNLEEDVRRICSSVPEQLGTRPFALLARKLKYLDWAREQKETWQNNAPWDRRAIIWATSALLSEDECKYWLMRVQNAGDLLDKAVATASLVLRKSTTDVSVQADQPIVEIKPVESSNEVKQLRPFALCAGEFVVPDDFNEPLPEEIFEQFEDE